MLIHVGLHKTGTTYLQHHVFPSAELGFRMVGDHKEIIERVVLANPYAYGPGRLRDVFGPRLEAAKKASFTPVISCERLSGSPAAGECWWADGTERLAEAFPEADIVLTIREQGSILASIYKHLIRNWLSASIREFLDQEPLSRGFLPICRLEYYEYHWMISHCMRLTGSADRVHVLPFEWLRESPTRFIQPIMGKRRLAEVQLPREVVNRGFCSLACSLQRRANRWCVRSTSSAVTGIRRGWQGRCVGDATGCCPSAWQERRIAGWRDISRRSSGLGSRRAMQKRLG